ncbi:hypothetical protein DPMN_168487 [Dreissena polymorpha]|uniref:Uncharacterized protein n=1 Tax=Dreissena polymorpha TaxID=45954 RepID=A0A9D4F5N7_DREPO|nr:hypothetical protein DPMN_168487 [Dreissena polymorpha]
MSTLWTCSEINYDYLQCREFIIGDIQTNSLYAIMNVIKVVVEVVTCLSLGIMIISAYEICQTNSLYAIVIMMKVVIFQTNSMYAIMMMIKVTNSMYAIMMMIKVICQTNSLYDDDKGGIGGDLSFLDYMIISACEISQTNSLYAIMIVMKTNSMYAIMMMIKVTNSMYAILMMIKVTNSLYAIMIVMKVVVETNSLYAIMMMMKKMAVMLTCLSHDNMIIAALEYCKTNSMYAIMVMIKVKVAVTCLRKDHMFITSCEICQTNSLYEIMMIIKVVVTGTDLSHNNMTITAMSNQLSVCNNDDDKGGSGGDSGLSHDIMSITACEICQTNSKHAIRMLMKERMIRPSFANEVRTTLTDGRTDRRTDGRTDAGYTIIRPVIDGRIKMPRCVQYLPSSNGVGVSIVVCQPKGNKRISRSAAARRNESMRRQSLKPRQYEAASRISPRNFASVRRGMPRSAT